MSGSNPHFEKLKDQLRSTARFGYAASLLAWDQRSYMPPAGTEARAEVTAAIETEAFTRFTSPLTGELCDKLSTGNGLGETERMLVSRVASMYDRQRKVPADFFENFSRTKAHSQSIWVKAKHASDFKMFQPHLEKIFKNVRELADIYGYKENPYDALLCDYEPGLTTKILKGVVEDLKPLKNIVKILTQAKQPDEKILSGHFPLSGQTELCMLGLKAVQYNLDSGRLDESEHPFTINVGPDDIRLTTNFKVWNWTPAFFATLHEAGHGLYEQGKDEVLKWFYQDLGYSLGIHESQSRMWENMVGRSLAFWKFFYPQLCRIFPYYREVPLKDFYAAINVVKPSPIRTAADEVTYNLHVMLRFELEEALLNKKLEVKDLPQAWNSKLKEYLGILPKNDGEGVLQDIHWSGGMVGYFPTYMLGNLYSAQMLATIK
ncbi:MAG: carboxypeptidase M32, partial [candidate division Zixibacteria bacterium]|nr:carboxypeptidase M32 [candidate division Zixibacteria bacterium]